VTIILYYFIEFVISFMPILVVLSLLRTQVNLNTILAIQESKLLIAAPIEFLMHIWEAGK